MRNEHASPFPLAPHSGLAPLSVSAGRGSAGTASERTAEHEQAAGLTNTSHVGLDGLRALRDVAKVGGAGGGT